MKQLQGFKRALPYPDCNHEDGFNYTLRESEEIYDKFCRRCNKLVEVNVRV